MSSPLGLNYKCLWATMCAGNSIKAVKLLTPKPPLLPLDFGFNCLWPRVTFNMECSAPWELLKDLSQVSAVVKWAGGKWCRELVCAGFSCRKQCATLHASGVCVTPRCSRLYLPVSLLCFTFDWGLSWHGLWLGAVLQVLIPQCGEVVKYRITANSPLQHCFNIVQHLHLLFKNVRVDAVFLVTEMTVTRPYHCTSA